MKKNNVKQFKINPLSIMKELGHRIETDKFLPDEEFWDDRLYWMKKNYNSDVDRYKSKNTKDKKRILYYDKKVRLNGDYSGQVMFAEKEEIYKISDT